MEFGISLASHHTKLVEHERRLHEHDDALERQNTTLTEVRIELAKFFVAGALVIAIFSSASTALIVHYLTPRQPATVRAGR
jgi:hypothetical protein